MLNYKIISKYRNHIMGFAMLWVILFHSKSTINGPLNIIKVIGYGGVDIFLMLSGLGLYFSYVKNENKKEFYYRRLIRILPTYIPLVLIFTIISHKIDIKTIFLNITTLSFWMNNPNKFDWYIPSLMILYLITPVYLDYFEKYRSKATLLLIFLSIILSIILSTTKLNYLLIFTIRIPVFLLGIQIGYYIDIDKKIELKSILLYIILLVVGLIFLIFNIKFFDKYLFSLGLWWYPFILITLPLCLLLSALFDFINIKIKLMNKVLLFFGVYSLEIYIFHERILNIVNNIKLNTNTIIIDIIAISITICMSILWKKILTLFIIVK